MEGENIEDPLDLLCDTDSDDPNSDYENYLTTRNLRHGSSAQPIEPPAPEKYIDLEEYIQDKCENKLTILDRSTFEQIQRPIIISFNNFREKCYYHTKWLDRLYQLSLKYGDQIEFIVADNFDRDVMYPHWNPIGLFFYLVRPEDESIKMYALDKKKRIHEYFDSYKTIDSLSELCENLLSDKLYPSQPVPEKKDNFVKTCVHLNYDNFVTECKKNVLLIVGSGDYRPYKENDPNYETIAKDLRDLNVDIVYIDGDKNYVPFKFNVGYYPTILFIPCNDKENFIRFFKGPRDTENLMKFINENIGSHGASFRQTEIRKIQYQPFTLPEGMDIHFNDLNQYVKEYFPKSMEVLDRNTFNKSRKCVVIYFMDFIRNGVSYYDQTLKLIHQVAEAKYYYGVEYLIADLKDIDVIYPKWYSKYLADLNIDKDVPQVFAIDHMKRTYKLDAFKTASSLFYYSFRLTYSYFFYSQPWTLRDNHDLVKPCVAHNLNMFIKNSKKDIFLAIYWDTHDESIEVLNTLDEIANEAITMNVKMMKMDAKWNYVPLEYMHTKYPVYFFIPLLNKDKGTIRYTSTSSSGSKAEILGFIQANVKP